MSAYDLRRALEEAGLHAFRIRAARLAPMLPAVELHIRPDGVEVDAWSDGRKEKCARRLIGWLTIEQAKHNVLVQTIDELVAKVR